MGKYTQKGRMLSIATPLGDDVVYLLAFDGCDEHSRISSYKLEMFSDDDNIQAKDIVGKNVTVAIAFPDSSPRFFNGFISRWSNEGTGPRGTQYKAEMVPWLWFLTKTADCRIFQDKDVKEIIEKIFSDLGFTDFDMSGVTGSHPKREYCVQYRETDFNFVSRLMQQEGIFYFFKHENGKHTLMMADSKSAYKDAVDNKAIYIAERAGEERHDNIKSWDHNFEFRSGKVMFTDYNFKKPNNTRNPTYEILKGNTNSIVQLDGMDKLEIYDYPGEYTEPADAATIAKVRMEEEEAGHDIVTGTSICRSFNPGSTFTVEKHKVKSEVGKKYVITSVTHSARVTSYITGAGEAEDNYSNSFTCIPANVQIRPERKTPKPQVSGVQTAVVTGPPGEEIWPDEYGRVKVQFHWDREGKMDDKSSCWIRSAMPGAGRGFGIMSIPRIGQEVIVTFIDGNPDRPIITGSVYNPGQMPARKLPDCKTMSYIRSNSSPGGQGHNEIQFEDAKGKEQIYLHGEKDVNIRCKNNYNLIVGYEKSDGSFRELVMNKKEAVVKGDQNEKIEGNAKMLVLGDSDTVVKGKKKETTGENHLHVKGDRKTKMDGNDGLTVGSNYDVKAGMNYALEAGMNVHIKAGMCMVLEAGLQLTLKVGGNFVDISPVGVAINGTMVLINSGGAAGSGSGSSPAAPSDAAEAAPVEPNMDNFSESGQKSCPS
ncbi:MAG: type VI secretion system tip protein VgrG [Planctomycetota bacterium]|nr:MAG: type VI secretion system tip protein VgrG [Planctomycetota bacterium]